MEGVKHVHQEPIKLEMNVKLVPTVNIHQHHKTPAPYAQTGNLYLSTNPFVVPAMLDNTSLVTEIASNVNLENMLIPLL
jgi:hypothetical protein